MGDKTAKARLEEVRVTKTKFADDVAVYATTREMLQQVGKVFVRTVKEWGLTVSLEKTKLLTVGRQLNPEDSQPVKLEEGEIATVEGVALPETVKYMVMWWQGWVRRPGFRLPKVCCFQGSAAQY